LYKYKGFANKTTADISNLKASMKLDGYQYAICGGDQTLSNIIKAANELMDRIGEAPVGILTAEERAARAEKLYACL
jgi:hypothetical protein